MEKNLLNDVEVPAHKRSIRDIPIPQARKNTSDFSTTESHDVNAINLKNIKVSHPADTPPRKQYTNPYSTSPTRTTGEDFFAPEHIQKKSRRGLLVSVSTIAVLVIGFFVVNLFHNANVTVYPKNAQSDIKAEIPILNNELKKNSSDLTYKVFEFRGEVSEDVAATGEEYVSEKASGKIIIVNEFATKSQNLIKNTRFEAPNGKIYRVQDNVTVPGYKLVSGKIIPGEIEVTVYADAAGTGYENGIVNFKIPSFKGQPQYDTLYAKSKTNMTGGFVGTRKVISAEQLKTAQDSIRLKLQENLQQNLKEQLPNNLIALDSTEEALQYDDIKRDESGKDGVKLTLAGTLKVKVVDKNKLSEKIAESAIGESYVIGSPILVTNLGDLKLKLLETEMLAVEGAAKFVWQIDEDGMKQKIASRNQLEAINMFSEFNGIDRVEINIFPMWINSFPEDTEKIEVTQVLPN